MYFDIFIVCVNTRTSMIKTDPFFNLIDFQVIETGRRQEGGAKEKEEHWCWWGKGGKHLSMSAAVGRPCCSESKYLRV